MIQLAIELDQVVSMCLHRVTDVQIPVRLENDIVKYVVGSLISLEYMSERRVGTTRMSQS